MYLNDDASVQILDMVRTSAIARVDRRPAGPPMHGFRAQTTVMQDTVYPTVELESAL